MPLELYVLSKISIMNSLVISASPMGEKQNFFHLDDKILYDADCADMSRYGYIPNSQGPIRISFVRWVYLSIDKHNNPRTRE